MSKNKTFFLNIKPIELTAIQNHHLIDNFSQDRSKAPTAVNEDILSIFHKIHSKRQNDSFVEVSDFIQRPQKIDTLNKSHQNFQQRVPMSVRATMRTSHEISKPKDQISKMMVNYHVSPMKDYRVKVLADVNANHRVNKSMHITENSLRNSANNFNRQSMPAKHDDFPIESMSKTINPSINLTTSMSKWNAKITPKLNKEKSSETPNNDFQFSSRSPNIGENGQRLLKKPGTARTTSRNRHVRPSLVSKQTQNSYRSTNQETLSQEELAADIRQAQIGDLTLPKSIIISKPLSKLQEPDHYNSLVSTVRKQETELQSLKQIVRESMSGSNIIQQIGAPTDRNIQSAINPTLQVLSQDAAHVHTLYQQVYIQDMRKEMEKKDSDLQRLRQQILLKDKQLAEIMRENETLKSKIHAYRMVAVKEQQPESQQTASHNRTEANHYSDQKPIITVQQSNQEETSTKQLSIGSFNQSQHQLIKLLSAPSVPELIEAARQTLLQVFKAERVDFLLMDKEFAAQFQSDGGKTMKLYHAYFLFEAAIPKHFDTKREEFTIKPAFTNLLDVRNKLYLHHHGRTCVWAVMNPEATNKYMYLIQISIQRDGPRTFNSDRDQATIRGLAEVINFKYQSLVTQRKVKDSQLRAVQILDTCKSNSSHQLFVSVKSFLADRNHVSVCKRLLTVFPSLFKFEKCGVLFSDPVSKELFKISLPTDGSIEAQNKEFDNLIKFPTDMGCTGVAIQQDEIVYFNEGEKMNQFVDEIDNSMEVGEVSNLMIGPIRDTDGELRGVVQLANKLKGEKITSQDVYEFGSLMPALGEIFKTTAEVRQFKNTSNGVHQRLIEMRGSLFGQIQQIDDNKMNNISRSVHNVTVLVKELIDNKKKALLSDQSLQNEVFAQMREQKRREGELEEKARAKQEQADNTQGSKQLEEAKND